MKHKLIVFDWDGTLADSPLRIVKSFQRAAVEAGVPVPDDDAIRYTIGMSLQESLPMLLGEISDEKYNLFVERYRYQFHHPDAEPMPLFDGVREGLAELNDKGYWITVGTGKARFGLDKVLEELDMKDVFLTTRCADESRGKPHPQMLYDILEYTGLEASDGLMIGDTTHDINMAHNANMAALAVTHGAHDRKTLEESKPLAIVDDFAGIMEFILKQ